MQKVKTDLNNHIGDFAPIGKVSIVVKTDSRLSKNGLKKTHHRKVAQLTKEHRETAYVLAHEAKFELGMTQPFPKAFIYVKSFWCGVRMDYDGLACSVAPAIDGMVDAGILEDDNPNIVQGYYMSYERVTKRSMACVQLSIEGVELTSCY